MDEKSSLNSLKVEDGFALFVGLIVAVVHFGSTVGMLIVENETYSLGHYLAEFIGIILLAPSLPLTTWISDSLQIYLPALDDYLLSSLLVIAYSSALYGIAGRLVASSQKLLRQLGIALISLLILSSCCALEVLY